MNFKKSDAVRALSLSSKLNNNVKFNDIGAKEVIELYHDFVWLDSLRKTIDADLERQVVELKKQQEEIAKKAEFEASIGEVNELDIQEEVKEEKPIK